MTTPIAVSPMAPSVPHNSAINLVNLLMRETEHRVTVLRLHGDSEPDPEIYIVTRVKWRSEDVTKPILSQLPGVLSLLETLRGSKGVPKEIYLDSTEGVVCFIPTGVRASGVPMDPKAAVIFLKTILEETVKHFNATRMEVEEWFWKTARREGFSPEIAERVARRETGYDSFSHQREFNQLLQSYFSMRFRVYRAESCLRLEDV